MTQTEFNAVFNTQLGECEAILAVKGVDYTDGSDRLSNFKDVAKLTGMSPLQVWGIYWAKHVIAIMNYAGRGTVESEPIEGRIVDAINYLFLLRGLIEEGRCQTNVQS